MFRGSYQRKLLTILYSGGSNPLEIWNIQVKNGWTRRVKDECMGTIVFEICGTNVATAYIVTPPDPRGALGISLPFITMFIKNLKRYFTFEIQILDDKQMRRRFRFSNYQSSTKVRPFTCSVPLALKPGWNQMQLNLANFTTRAYGTNYMETQRVQIHANCRIRRVYFSDRLYTEEELPRDYRIYLNVRQAPPLPAEPSQTSSMKQVEHQGSGEHPASILKKGDSVHTTASELVTQTTLRTASATSLRTESKRTSRGSRSVHSTTQLGKPEEAEEGGSRHSVHSRVSQRSVAKSEGGGSLSKVDVGRSMSAIVEEKEPQTPEVEGEVAEGTGPEEMGDTGAPPGEEIQPGEIGTEDVAEIPQESAEESPRGEEESPRVEEESPRVEEESPVTEEQSPRTEEDSPRSEMVESEFAESEPIPESDAEVPESEAGEAPPEQPPESPDEPAQE